MGGLLKLGSAQLEERPKVGRPHERIGQDAAADKRHRGDELAVDQRDDAASEGEWLLGEGGKLLERGVIANPAEPELDPRKVGRPRRLRRRPLRQGGATELAHVLADQEAHDFRMLKHLSSSSSIVPCNQ
jgi:hypothetical protein